jgi:SAM-dependent methyltransferase
VWSISAVHHWDDVAGGLDEVRRVLRPGGRLLAMERRIRAGSSGLASHGWSPPQAESFAAACRAAGLDDVTVSAHDVGESVFLAVLASRRERAHEAGPAHSSRDS